MEIRSFTEQFFAEDSPLNQALQAGGRAYEYRPQQQRMAVAVAEHFQSGSHLCVEAPTGVGKTFAYLIPAILYALEQERPVVVSTHTISLQEQILNKDIPVLQALLEVPFEAAVAKGRSNYLCLRRLQALGEIDRERIPEAGMLKELAVLWDWVGTTATGSSSDLEIEPSRTLWEAVCCEPGNCLGQNCPHRRHCFLMRARRRLDQAQIIVANHALFFSDLAMNQEKATGVLPSYAGVVLDESHTIEDCAADHLGVHVGSFALRHVLRRLYREDRDMGLLADGPWEEARQAVFRAAKAADMFFRRVVEWLEPQARDPLRYTVPGHIPNYLAPHLQGVTKELRKVTRDLSQDPDSESLGREISGIADRIQEMEQGLELFLSMSRDDFVYWFERRGRERQDVVFNAVPIAVGPLLHESLFSLGIPVILTSATLAVRQRLDYFQARVGAESAQTMVLDSPFDFERQVTLHIPSGMPNPADRDRFESAAADAIRRYLTLSRGRAFVLFTSYVMMRSLAADLEHFFAEKNIRLLVQGEGMPRHRMLEIFREDLSSVIFGTASFWTGVDVPGEALSNVIIVRLPFSVPDHPLVAARQEAIERRGGRAFTEYSLPEAILRFRQGFGRLIRSRTDTGMVVILDNRVVSKSYGKAFLQSIPRCAVVRE